MSLVLTIFCVAISTVLLYAVLVELNDLPRCQRGDGWRRHLMHHVRAIGLVLIGASAGMSGFQTLVGKPIGLLSLAMLLGLTLVYASRGPEWVRYLMQGDRRQGGTGRPPTERRTP